MSRRTYGILAGVIGFGAWWYARQRGAQAGVAERARGTVIYHNTPTATPLSDAEVI